VIVVVGLLSLRNMIHDVSDPSHRSAVTVRAFTFRTYSCWYQILGRSGDFAICMLLTRVSAFGVLVHQPLVHTQLSRFHYPFLRYTDRPPWLLFTSSVIELDEVHFYRYDEPAGSRRASNLDQRFRVIFNFWRPEIAVMRHSTGSHLKKFVIDEKFYLRTSFWNMGPKCP
jgi:hypothetical protein